MMDWLFDPRNFEFIARNFLAGYILLTVRSHYVLGEKPKASEIIFEAVVLSLVIQLAFALLAWVVGFAGPLHPGLSAAVADLAAVPKLSFFLEVVLFPVVLGIFIGVGLRRGWTGSVLRRLGMPIIHPTRRAYDFAFGDNRQESFVIVTYSDGTQVYGYFGQGSLAASDASRSDLYLEFLYDVDADGTWQATNPPKSALLGLEGMRSIEFIPAQKEH